MPFDDQDERAFPTQGRVMFISMVEEPTKMLRGALAFFRGASCSVKSRDPIGVRSDMDFSTARPGVNAANKNKRVLVGWAALGRMKSPGAAPR